MSAREPHIVPVHQFMKKPMVAKQPAQILSQSDLDRIRNNAQSVYQKEETLKTTLKQTDLSKDQIARTRMQKLQEGDDFRKTQKKPTNDELQLKERARQLQDNALRAQVEQDDIAKIMNTLELQARAFAVRDRQLVIQQRVEIDRQMEKQRDYERNQQELAQLKRDEELKKQKAIRDQEIMKENADVEHKRKQTQKLLQEESKLREAELYRQKQKQQIEAEKQLLIEKRENQRKINEETAKINEVAQLKKQKDIEAEKELDQKIKKKMMQDELDHLESEKRKIELEKENTRKFLLKQQEFQDQNKVFKEIEAQRENAAREKQEREFQSKQEKIKQQKLLELKQTEEFERKTEEQRQLKKQKEAIEMAREAEKMKLERKKWQMEQMEKRERQNLKAFKLAEEFEDQIKETKTMRMNTEDPKLELTKINQEKDKKKQMLQALKNEKLQALRQAGVDEKYIVSLEALDIEELMRR
uniref:Trichohyalin n=1 Tax=Trepomonas sp. PC1 TaxID=1076344 RepID=A0A146KAN6_9EUKA|eukprot:JAP92576.1 hypothetical protein TPC1_15436 [Trepomonas sp. PC1]